MKLLFLSDLWKPFPGGAEQFMFNIARQMAARGHSIDILTSYERAEAGDASLPRPCILPLLGGPGNRVERSAALRRHIDQVKPDRIFVHRYFAEEYGQELEARDSRVPVVELVHQNNKLRSPYLRIFNSEYTKRRNTNEYAQPHMVIIPPAFSDVVAPSHEGNLIGFVKPTLRKGVDLVYRLATNLKENHFVIMRGEWRGVEVNPKFNLPNVSFIEPEPRMADFYKLCRIVLMPSLEEEAGTIPQEAAMNGLPCISSDVGGLPETNGGYVLRVEDENIWTKAIKDLFQSPDKYKEMVCKQTQHLATFAWAQKFDELDRRIR